MGAKSFEPGAKFKDCAACPTMVVIPNGNFMMGWRDIFDGTESPYSEEGSLHKLTYSEEGPPHKVTIAKAFAVGRTHITRGEFTAFVEATGYTANGGCNTRIGEEWKLNSRYSWLSPGFVQNDSHPVVCVSWEDAKAYTKWLSERTGKTYRLMSEAEEEYIARGNATLNTKQTHYFFGNRKEKLCVYANVADKTYGTKFNSEVKKVAPCRDDYVFTAPVAHFRPNAFGLYDIHGNVNTWTEDCWDGGSSLVPVDGSAWSEEGCKRRVFRGGSWSSIPLYLHITSRFARMPNYRGDYIGFRVARTLE
jgi:formylglycine-generating enzyme required for sulfatase activity